MSTILFKTLWSDPEAAGLLNLMLDDEDERPAVAQLDSGYVHGGGWCDFDGFTVTKGETTTCPITISYPGDPPLQEISRAYLRHEIVVLFPYSWVLVHDPVAGTDRIARMD